MSKKLEALLHRARRWPEDAQDELMQLGEQIEIELKGDYQATQDELRVIDAALAAIDRGEIASEEKVETAFVRFRRK
ncbi:MAG: hypothetical protein ACREFD_10735 [Stellaceae bacterium]